MAFVSVLAPLPLRRRPDSLRPSLRRPRAATTAPVATLAPVPIPPALSTLKVVGLGACGMDMLAVVPSYPRPDEKTRTTSTVFCGGGNCANALTALRRLGLPAALLAKIGDDAHGAAVLAELQADGVDTTHVVVKPRMRTPFTYVLVDAQTKTRTCIHTPADEVLLPSDLDLPGEGVTAAGSAPPDSDPLAGASLLLLDGRHTLAAITLARAANARNIPVLIDVERDRPHLATLLRYCDYMVTSSTYPFVAHPGAQGRVDAMTRLLLRSGRARAVVSTAGEAGATVVARAADARCDRRDPQLVVTRERIAAAAVGRFGAGRSEMARRGEAEEGEEGEIVVLQCPAWPVEEVVDTCGAGDAFVGGVAYGIAVGLGVEGWLGLGTRVAARQIGMLGARPGLPRREEMDAQLLTSLPKV